MRSLTSLIGSIHFLKKCREQVLIITFSAHTKPEFHCVIGFSRYINLVWSVECVGASDDESRSQCWCWSRVVPARPGHTWVPPSLQAQLVSAGARSDTAVAVTRDVLTWCNNNLSFQIMTVITAARHLKTLVKKMSCWKWAMITMKTVTQLTAQTVSPGQYYSI